MIPPISSRGDQGRSVPSEGIAAIWPDDGHDLLDGSTNGREMLSSLCATISPQPGPQTEFLRTAADICMYGGAAGGGKTVGLILEPLRYVSQVPGFTAVFFRRTTPEIINPGGLWDESLNFYPRFGGIPHHRAHEWRWPLVSRF
jgi:hypothetical protein